MKQTTRILFSMEPYDETLYAEKRNRLTETGHIGGSYAGAILGLHPYVTPFRAWLELKGMLSADKPDTERMWIGRRLENVVAEMFSEREGINIEKAQAIYQHVEHDWMIATPDFHAYPSDGRLATLEIKTLAGRMADNWAGDKIYDPAHAQLLHTMAVTGVKVGYIAALIGGFGGMSLEVRKIEPSEETLDQLVNLEYDFWRSLQNDEPPDLEPEDVENVPMLWPSAQQEMAALPDAARRCIHILEETSTEMSELKKQQDRAKAELMMMMADREIGTLDGTPRVSYKEQTRKGYVVQPKTFRVLRVIKEKTSG